MSLVDATTGLEFGTGLQWAKPIGGTGLDIVTGAQPITTDLLWGTANDLLWGSGNILTWGT